jgi:hypothetical protein
MAKTFTSSSLGGSAVMFASKKDMFAHNDDNDDNDDESLQLCDVDNVGCQALAKSSMPTLMTAC